MVGVVNAPTLRYLRQKRLLTQKELASKAGVAFTSIVHLEAGGAARYVTIRKLAEALGVAAEDLAEPTAEEAQPPRAG